MKFEFCFILLDITEIVVQIEVYFAINKDISLFFLKKNFRNINPQF